MPSTSQTLAQRIAAGRIPATDALRIGMLLADQLRQLHEQDRTHGALSPSMVTIAGGAIHLLPANEARPGVTPYTAPELLRGEPADARSDIFSFGAMLYEMLTGRRAFAGATPDELAAALLSASPKPSGDPAIDRLVGECMAKSPDARFQQVQKLMLELRMLNATNGAGNRQVGDWEARISERLEQQERAVAGVAEVANEVLRTLREQNAGQFGFARSAEPLEAGLAGRLEHAIGALSDRLNRIDLVVSSMVERLQKFEANLDSWDIDAAALRDTVTRDIRGFEKALKAQNAAIESTRTAMSQTDDLVERVVEALDSMQSMAVSAPVEHPMAS